jgi:hypothetical protein
MCTTTNLHCLSKRVRSRSCLNMRNRTKTEAKSNENLKMVTSVLCRFLLPAKVRHYLHRVLSVLFIIIYRRKEGKSFELTAGFTASVFVTTQSEETDSPPVKSGQHITHDFASRLHCPHNSQYVVGRVLKEESIVYVTNCGEGWTNSVSWTGFDVLRSSGYLRVRLWCITCPTKMQFPKYLNHNECKMKKFDKTND